MTATGTRTATGRPEGFLLEWAWLGIPALVAVLMVVGAAPAQEKKLANSSRKIDWAFSTIGQFGFKVQDSAGKWQPITYSFFGHTNSTMLKIDDAEWVLGGQRDGLKPARLKSATASSPLGKTFVWECGPIEVRQTVAAHRSAGDTYDVCLISYTLTNHDTTSHKVALRHLLDTLLVDNDACAFLLPGAKNLIVDKKSFSRDNMPEFVTVQQYANLQNPGLQVVLTLKIGKNPPPNTFLITRMPLEPDRWDVPFADIRDDSAVVFYWDAMTLKKRESVHVGYAYGLHRYQPKK